MRPEDMIGALDQQRPEVDIASLGDAELRVVVPGLAASRPQAEITAYIATSLEAFLAAQCQDIRQCRELADAIDFDQRLRLRVSIVAIHMMPYSWPLAASTRRRCDLADLRPCHHTATRFLKCRCARSYAQE